MPNILHLVENLDNSNTIQAIISTAKWSSSLQDHNHSIAALNSADPQITLLATDAGIRVLDIPDAETLLQEIKDADIVQIEFLNTPTINTLLRRELPPSRLAMWCHISGDKVPHIIPQAAAKMVDVCIASSATSYDELSELVHDPNFELEERTRLILPSADFSRLQNIERQSHTGFNIGHFGAHDLADLHPEYLAMSAAIELVDAQFIICGEDAEDILASQAHALQATDRFTFKKDIEDINSVFEILDVFGYGVSEQASTAALQLQSAMFAGIPPIVFAHKAIEGLIKHNETGLIVHSAEDYKRAVQYLYNNPVERKRIGLNASIYARTHFGARNGASDMNKVYDFLMTQPKQNHVWDYSPYKQELLPQHIETPSAALIFVEAMDKKLPAFEISLNHSESAQQIEAEQTIANASSDLFNAIQQQALHAPNDPYLKLWAGLHLEQHDQASLAVTEFASALENGLDSWRVQWYLARTLFKTGKVEESKRIYAALRQEVPDFDGLTGDTQFIEAQHRTINLTIPGASETIEAADTTETAVDTTDANGQIRVSALVSTYASEEFIDGCLHNLVSQSLFQKGELEIIVIDANSPENEQEIVARYQANFENIQYVRTPARETLYASWNRGIELAKGQYVTSANTDDRHKKDALETLANYLDAHPEFALLYPGQIDTSVPNESFETTTSSKLLNWPPYSYAELERHCIIGSQPMWRKSLHETHGYFRAEMKSAADYEFWLRIGKHENMYRYPETLGLYYRNPEGIEHGSQTSEMETLQIWQEYGMFDRGIQVILRGRLITKASQPNFTPPVSTQPRQKLSFDVYITNFETAIQQKDYEEALAIAVSAEQNYRELPYPAVLKAMAHRQRSEYAMALEALENSIQIDETPEALIELIQLSSATGQLEEAKRTAEYMKTKYPEWEERLDQFNAALHQDQTAPASGPAKLEDLNYSLNTFTELKEEFGKLLHFKEISKAETLALAATLKFPDNHESWVLKATSNRLKGQYIEARDAIHKSLLIEDSPEALIELFQVSQALGDDEEASNIAGMFDHTYPEYSMRFNELFPGTIQ